MAPTFRRTLRPLALVGAAAAGLAIAACRDSATAPLPVRQLHPLPKSGPRLSISSSALGDTTISTFVLTGTSQNTWVVVAGEHQIVFRDGVASVCDPATSTYGPTEWDKPCTPASSPITITAKTWKNALGQRQVDFTPALRFVPTSEVTLYMYNKSLTANMFGAQVNYCPTSLGGCYDDATLDPAVSSQVQGDGYIARRAKHFSGYIIALGRECQPGDEYMYEECSNTGM